MPPGLVIFDCDGVLVDSVTIDIRELTYAIEEIGGMMAESDVRAAFNGASITTIERGVAAHLGRPAPAAWIERWMMARAAAFERELEAVVGAADAVRGVQRLGCETCVASQGEIEKMQQTLRVTELASCFAPERIFSATMVANGKPAPDLYLHAADACGFSVADCLVVEDSVTGVTAARAAGMRVLGFVAEPMRDAEPAQRMAALGAELFHDMREVPARVAG